MSSAIPSNLTTTTTPASIPGANVNNSASVDVKQGGRPQPSTAVSSTVTNAVVPTTDTAGAGKLSADAGKTNAEAKANEGLDDSQK